MGFINGFNGMEWDDNPFNICMYIYILYIIYIYIYYIYLVVGTPTPLKNHGVQVTWDDLPFPTLHGKSFKIPWFQSPPTRYIQI